MEYENELTEKIIEYLEIHDLLDGYDIVRYDISDHCIHYKVRCDGIVESISIRNSGIDCCIVNKNSGMSKSETFVFGRYMNNYFDDDTGKVVYIVVAKAEIIDGNIEFLASDFGSRKRLYTTDIKNGGLFDKDKFIHMIRTFYKIWA